MKQLTIRQRILASFGLILSLMLVMAVFSYILMNGIDQDANSLQEDSMPGFDLATDIRAAWFENYTVTQRLVFIDTAPEAMQRDAQRIGETRDTLDKLIATYGSTIFEERDRQLFNQFKQQRELYVPIQAQILRELDTSKEAAAATFNTKLTPVWETGRGNVRTLVDHNKSYADKSVASIRESVRKSEITLLVIMLVAIAAAAVLGYVLLRAVTVPMHRLVDVVDRMRTGDLTQRLDLNRQDEFATLEAGFNRMTDELTGLVGQAQKSAVQVTTSVSEIAATAKEQQATASETAATTTEIGATSREIFATSRDLARTMNEVSSVAEQSAALAGTGHVGLTRMEETMRLVMEAAGSVNGKLAILNEKASNINQVVATITKVADQTNLLSLNAAIEAEKAGEYGRGFSVVATEIRRLADQTAVATLDIEQMVKEIQSAVAAGVMGMDKFSEEVRRGMLDVQHVGGQLSQIIQQVQALAPRFVMVSEGMQTQATGADQITQGLAQLSEAAQQTAESLRQSSQAIEDLTHVANGLRTGVSRFKVAT
ncbi:Methyl-accepting chemotaxis protein I (serine chemoreceptor protein) [Caballeronia glathei]|uniref:methyl-accepting chemotaxis protein n=1 Tax=Caballeronia glathei TaxID=60547 RepID=UPI0005026EDB|nr:methyl-accepting chemotaxis protein [Caballeronia glathei]CDY77506.1 Methyl-accepting chemotaxis protein I (serine chemoreceptor protein) [Caballeronia glathei]